MVLGGGTGGSPPPRNCRGIVRIGRSGFGIGAHLSRRKACRPPPSAWKVARELRLATMASRRRAPGRCAIEGDDLLSLNTRPSRYMVAGPCNRRGSSRRPERRKGLPMAAPRPRPLRVDAAARGEMPSPRCHAVNILGEVFHTHRGYLATGLLRGLRRRPRRTRRPVRRVEAGGGGDDVNARARGVDHRDAGSWSSACGSTRVKLTSSAMHALIPRGSQAILGARGRCALPLRGLEHPSTAFLDGESRSWHVAVDGFSSTP